MILSTFIAVFYSCSTDVELYTDYKDIPIIYGILDPKADTNYIRITRAFCGTNDNPLDANEVVMIYDSSNYPDKLDARIIELRSANGETYAPTGREMLLDTITLHDKEDGVFYSPDQIFYYTTERFNTGTANNRYRYRLVVVKPDGDTVTAQTNMIGNEEFRILTDEVSFQIKPTLTTKQLSFRPDKAASLYEIIMLFNYREQLAGHAMKHKTISHSFGTKNRFEYSQGPVNSYVQDYSINWLFAELEKAIGGDTIWDLNHPNVIRYIDDFVIIVHAGGDELNTYYLENQALLNTPTPLYTFYTNVHGGFGLFSARTTIQRTARITARTKREFFSVPRWGFREQ